jgi:DNA-binding NtrC family response regulator
VSAAVCAKIALVSPAACIQAVRVDLGKIYILVLDRNPKSANSTAEVLKSMGCQVFVATHESEALALAQQQLFNLVVKSFHPNGVDAIAFMNRVRAATPDTQFIFISEKATIQVAVDAIRKGVYDYLCKPVKPPQLIESVRKALDFQALVAEDQVIKIRLRRRSDPDIFAGKSLVMSEVDRLIRQIAPTDVTVLVEGESGTGKELVARAIHERSRRSGRPFIAVNCGALPENLLESELFGHIRGAFTGAIGDRKGRFQLAHNGTLFLDEIADLSPKGQADLLRVLQDGVFRPVGSQKIERADARTIAATNKSLETESMNGRFREDLLYRLNVVTIYLPPLRERVEDIPQLVASFAEHYCAKHRRNKRFLPEVIRIFQTLPWPGNVRQLRNIVERLVVTVPRQTIGTNDLPHALLSSANLKPMFFIRPGMSLAQVEAELIRQTLVGVTSNRAEAAQKLGISRRALQYKIKRYGLGGLKKRITDPDRVSENEAVPGQGIKNRIAAKRRKKHKKGEDESMGPKVSGSN